MTKYRIVREDSANNNIPAPKQRKYILQTSNQIGNNVLLWCDTMSVYAETDEEGARKINELRFKGEAKKMIIINEWEE